MQEQFNIIIKNLVNLCHNNDIIHYVIRLLNDFKDNIIEINDKYVYARFYDEVLEINIQDNSFTIFSTNWGTTERKKIVFFRLLDNELLSIDNNQITKDGQVLVNFTYQYYNNELVSARYTKKVDLEYENQKDVSRISKEEKIDIYPIYDNVAVKKINNNGKIECFLTKIKPFNIDNTKIFSFINSSMDNKIDYDEYQKKIKKLK